jgi:tRNA(Arg) A34 adenosine deaminase TadA/predicted O-methyltransferase YrrM
MNDHERFARQAIDLARQARVAGNHPFGAVLVVDGRVVLTAQNTVGTDHDPTAHAETNLVREAIRTLTPEQIRRSVLYTSCEPCVMCAGKTYWAGIRSVVYALPAEELAVLAGRHFLIPCAEVFGRATETVHITGPLLLDEAREVHLGFWPARVVDDKTRVLVPSLGSMNDHDITRRPAAVDAILHDTDALGFNMASEAKVGALLAAVAASKPGGRFLELGTGTGHGTAWLLSGMDPTSSLETVDSDPKVAAVARRHLGSDSRVTFQVMDGAEFLHQAPRGQFDFIYADAWPGKFSHLDEALALLKTGGIYLIDDLLPQPNWPEGHAPRVPALIERLEHRREFISARLAWASGLMIVVRTTPDH